MIQVLSSEIINQIAAGEVVERPSHLVKELLENSLDAGSDQIMVEIGNGGRHIRVIDNGSGIPSTDLGKALQRHATSKITKTDDLWNLHTFGFRGEALASAAAVSKMTIKSLDKNEKNPAQIQSTFGVVSDIKPSSQTQGTEVSIEDLFENVPARLKFLKSDSTELAQIKLVVKALALAHPHVEFKMISNGDLQFFYPKRPTKLERAQDVLEKKQLFEAQSQFGNFKCHVAFSSPHEVAKNSKQVWIFVQNRWVQDRAIQAAVMDSYRSLLMHGEYPYAVVWLDCQPDEIDVNIHPTKSQIKFQDSSAAFRSVHSTLRHALEKAPWIPAAHSHQPVVEETHFNSEYKMVAENLKFSDHLHDHSFEKTQFKNKEINISLKDYEQLAPSMPTAVVREFAKNSNETVGYWSSLQVIGQANLTYIICQRQDRLVFVDQHAAHERVVYESLMRSWSEGKFDIQSYLFPLSLDLSEEKIEALLAQSVQIQKMGFEIEQLGPITLGLKSAPALVKDSSLPLVFDKMAHEMISRGGSYAIEKKISDLFATMACHSVVRAGQSLSVLEMQELLKSMDQFPMSSFCPHGRPVSVETPFTELEKLFGRIN